MSIACVLVVLVAGFGAGCQKVDSTGAAVGGPPIIKTKGGVEMVQVPAGESRCPPDPAPGEDRGDTYVVAPCETIHLIATRTGVSVQDLLAVNPQICNPNLIYAGQVLALPPRE